MLFGGFFFFFLALTCRKPSTSSFIVTQSRSDTNCSDISIWHDCPLWTVAKSPVLELRLDFESIGWYYMHVHRMHNSFSDNHPFLTSVTFQINKSPRSEEFNGKWSISSLSTAQVKVRNTTSAAIFGLGSSPTGLGVKLGSPVEAYLWGWGIGRGKMIDTYREGGRGCFS